MKNNPHVDKIYILIYILPLTMVFISTLASLYGLKNPLINFLLNIRGLSIIIISFFGYLLVRNGKCSKLSVIALLFSCYMMLVTIVSDSDVSFLIAFSTIFFWSFTLWIAEKSYFTTETYRFTALIVAIACNIMSVLYVYAKNSGIFLSLDNVQAVGAINSIYLILSLFSFIFLVENRVLQIVLFIFPLLAFITSFKSTCLVAASLSLLYYYRVDIVSSKHKWKFFLIVLFICFLFLLSFSKFINLSEIFSSFNEDLDSGGNGRIEHFVYVLDLFMKKKVEEQFLGSGLMAVASDTYLSAHNDFIEVLYDYGILGIIIFIVFWRQLFLRRRLLKSDKRVCSAYMVSLVIFFTVCLTSNFIISQIQMLFFSLLWGTITKFINYKYNSLQ